MTQGEDDELDQSVRRLSWNDALAWIGTLILLIGMTSVLIWFAFKTLPLGLETEFPVSRSERLNPVELPPPDTFQEDGRTIRNPGWRFRPEIEYPRQGMDVHEGKVRLLCKTTVDGELEDCVVVEEQPKGKGFAQAALAATDEAAVYPRTIDGVATAGTITFYVPFKMAN